MVFSGSLAVFSGLACRPYGPRTGATTHTGPYRLEGVCFICAVSLIWLAQSCGAQKVEAKRRSLVWRGRGRARLVPSLHLTSMASEEPSVAAENSAPPLREKSAFQKGAEKTAAKMSRCMKVLCAMVATSTLTPCDLGCGRKVHWASALSPSDPHGHGHGHGEHAAALNIFATGFHHRPWYHVPQQRHLWGESQYELHAGGKELFLDLIFVGVAYEVGYALKNAFYACDKTRGASASGSASGSGSSTSGSVSSTSGSGNSPSGSGASSSSSGSASGSGSSGRRLELEEDIAGAWQRAGHSDEDWKHATPSERRSLAAASTQEECLGLWIGILHAVAPFMSMYLLWGVETIYRGQCQSHASLPSSSFHFPVAPGALASEITARRLAHA